MAEEWDLRMDDRRFSGLMIVAFCPIPAAQEYNNKENDVSISQNKHFARLQGHRPVVFLVSKARKVVGLVENELEDSRVRTKTRGPTGVEFKRRVKREHI